MATFENRVSAGIALAQRLAAYRAQKPIVLGLPRGGVPVAYQVARALDAPLDVCVVRKVGVPWHPELGVGAVAEGGLVYLNRDIMSNLQLTEEGLTDIIRREQSEVTQRIQRFRGNHPRPPLKDRTLIVVDDGIAMGGTVRAAIASLRQERPKAIVLAVPVVAADVARALQYEVDELVALSTPHNLYAIGLWYEDFSQVPDEEVVRLLEMARREQQTSTAEVSP
ncbi:MAG TPA: phosphoribosyltransferase family protein [Polyangiaceae bacterium]|nr:phosphoribosyltransferase family protein [Polyangiaceae bacterium]